MKQASVITPPSISASFQVLPFHPSYPVILTSGVSTIQGLLLTVPLPFALGSVLIIPDGAIPGSEQMENLSGEPTWHILVPNHSSVAPSAQPHRHQHQLRALHDGMKAPAPPRQAGPSLCLKPPLSARIFLHNLFQFIIAKRSVNKIHNPVEHVA